MASVIVLAGGSSDEREISFRSGAAVAAALERAGHSVRQMDPVTEFNKTKLQAADVVFPVLHGQGGEDGSIQKQLEDLGVAYVGSGVEASELCFDKWQYKQFLRTHNIPMPNGKLVDEISFWNSQFVLRPFVLKPNDGGSSVDTLIHRTYEKPDEQTIRDIFTRHSHLLIEELIEGTEITVAVLGEQSLPIIEIIPPESGEFDYKNKYNGKSQELCPPKNVAEGVQEEAKALATKIHKLCGCRDFSRTDIMVTSLGQLWVLETNTIPGMTEQSLFPKASSTAGISMEQLVDQLVQMALARKA